jgi:hypothetical protein
MSRDLDAAVFRDHATARLEAGSIQYGDASYHRPVRELLGEILEEAADVATWGAITLTVLERDSPQIPAGDRTSIHTAITTATGHAEAVYHLITEALQALPATGPTQPTTGPGTVR